MTQGIAMELRSYLVSTAGTRYDKLSANFFEWLDEETAKVWERSVPIEKLVEVGQKLGLKILTSTSGSLSSTHFLNTLSH